MLPPDGAPLGSPRCGACLGPFETVTETLEEETLGALLTNSWTLDVRTAGGGGGGGREDDDGGGGGGGGVGDGVGGSGCSRGG